MISTFFISLEKKFQKVQKLTSQGPSTSTRSNSVTQEKIYNYLISFYSSDLKLFLGSKTFLSRKKITQTSIDKLMIINNYIYYMYVCGYKVSEALIYQSIHVSKVIFIR